MRENAQAIERQCLLGGKRAASCCSFENILEDLITLVIRRNHSLGRPPCRSFNGSFVNSNKISVSRMVPVVPF